MTSTETSPTHPIPPGKLPPELLQQVFRTFPQPDQRVLIGPGVGLDCAVVEGSSNLWVIKTDPITFATDQLGWYLVQVNANDIATTGAVPHWLMVTLLLPEGSSTPELVQQIAGQVSAACRKINISVIGGHTEITPAVNRPVAIGTMIGEVPPEKFIQPGQCQAGDHILLTKSIPIEATAILSRELAEPLKRTLSSTELLEAQNYLYEPGISVLQDAQIAVTAGKVTAMHDPTEGGLSTALWEMAQATRKKLLIDPEKILITPLSQKICDHFHIDPLGAIASGALLMAVPPASVDAVQSSLIQSGIPCADIGWVAEGSPEVYTAGSTPSLLPHPDRDEIARLFESLPPEETYIDL